MSLLGSSREEPRGWRQAPTTMKSPFVFIDDASRPFLVFNDWLHRWNKGTNGWVTSRPLEPGEIEALALRKLPDYHAALYGWPCQPPALHYMAEDSEAASRAWKATCGPHAIAAACGLTLERVRTAIPQPYKGWMSPTMVEGTLQNLRRVVDLRKGLKTPDLCNGINRIQWEGPWLNPGVPANVAYHHTHWVAHFDGWVLCAAYEPSQWITTDMWRHLLREKPFHITHHYTLSRP